MPSSSSKMSISADLTTPEENDSQSDHDTDLLTDDIDDTAEIGSDYEVSSESDEDNDEWKGRLNLYPLTITFTNMLFF